MEAIDGEIAAIHGEDLADPFSFRYPQKSSICQVHRPVGVFTHQFPHPWSVTDIQRQKLQGFTFQHFPKSLLGARLFGQKVHGFGHCRPHRAHWLAKGFQGGDAPGMVLVIGVNERDQRPGIDEDQRPLLRRLRSLVKRRPVRADPLGFPPWTTPIRSFMASYGEVTGSCRSAHASMARRMTSEVESCFRLAIRAMRFRVFSSSLSVSGEAMVSPFDFILPYYAVYYKAAGGAGCAFLPGEFVFIFQSRAPVNSRAPGGRGLVPSYGILPGEFFTSRVAAIFPRGPHLPARLR